MSGAPQERETDALLASVREATGVDFLGYARSGIARRIEALGGRDAASIAHLHARAMAEPGFMGRLAASLLVNVTSLFRDAPFFRAYRAIAVARLRAAVPLRAWHVGCATGEEVWSHRIVLVEEGLGRAARLYGTDLSRPALAYAAKGLLPLDRMQDYTAAYRASGGRRDFSSYYAARPAGVAVREVVREGVRFGRHDVVADPPFGPFDVVFCRNVLIYFDAAYQERAHAALAASLRPGGILALGNGDALPAPVRAQYDELDARNRIFLRRE